MRIELTGLASGELQPRAGQDFPGIGTRAAAGGVTGILGWSLTNAGATDALVRFRDGANDTGEIIASVSLTPQGSAGCMSVVEWDRGLSVYSGVYYEVVSGAVEGSIEVV